jgi:hypothetical protein
MKKFVATTMYEYLNKILLLENMEDYKGEHSAPEKEGFEPMHNINITFPDMYSSNALRYYGGYELDDVSVIAQIKSVRNKPNALIKIYRAVPNFNKDVDKEINDLSSIIKYYLKFKFFPMRNKIVDDLEEKIQIEQPSLSYDDKQNAILDSLYERIDVLNNKKVKQIKINDGD